MIRILFLLCIFMLFFEMAPAQIFRYRFGGNSGFFLGEPGDAELKHPQASGNSHPGSRDFESGFKMGAEAEIMAPLTTDFELGIEFDYTKLTGYTETALLYNFFLSRFNPLPDNYKYPSEALIYNTKLLNILGTARFYFLQLDENLNLFFKAFGGVAFVGTDFTFHDPFYRVEYNVGVLYSQGTKSNEEPKEVAFNGGGGLGVTFRISDKWDLYLDGTASFIHSDIVNGVPNYDYVINDGAERIQRTESWAIVPQLSIGLVYSAIPDRRLNKGNYTRSRRSSKSLFWKRKSSSPFSKRKRR
jgi:hypothetical protein